MRFFIRIVTLFVTALLLNGCGIKGPLYLPPPVSAAGQPALVWYAADHSNKTAGAALQRA